jgi:Ca2+-binding RTX toxin-like protein
VANGNQQRIAPPIPFLTAVWAGMSHEDILAGLRNGDIVRPPRLPDWAAGLDDPGSVAAADDGTTVSVDRAQVNAWFTALDPSLQPSAFDGIWNRAGATDSARASKLTSYLSNVLFGRSGADAPTALDAYLGGGAHHAKIVDLSGKSGEELASLAGTDIGYRYALAHLDSFAITGNRGLFAEANADHSLDQFDGDTGQPMASEAWLGDRSKFLAWKISQESGQTMAVAGNEDWTFIDRGSKGADGEPLTLQIKTGATDAGQNQVVFGTAEDEIFKGVSGSDRIYAGAGDDVLRGGRGGDHLEGGDGDDLAMGGAGNDEVLGGRGDDELDGGAGDDHLEGGSGDDTYVIDAGDGADTILDADGIGTIELDGDALRGTMQSSDGKWSSADHNVEFRFDGDLTTGGTLTISTFAGGASHDGPAQNTITVNDWKNGDLGITLGGDTDADAGQTSPAEGTPGSDTPAASTADLTTDTWADQSALSLDGSGSVTNDVAPPGATQVASDGAAQASHAGEGAIQSQSEFDAALESLLGNSSQAVSSVDPTSYQRAIEAFSSVLEPPDISDAGVLGDAADVGAVTEAAMADALAGDYSSDAFDAYEPTHAQALASVDVASLMELKQSAMDVHSRK